MSNAQRGLLKELLQLRKEMHEAHLPLDYSKGLLQAIGFKEFQAYLDALDSGVCGHLNMHKRTEFVTGKEAEEVDIALHECVLALKRRNRGYARAQLGWIAHHFRTRFPVYRLDSTGKRTFHESSGITHVTPADVSKWDERVLLPAAVIVKGLCSFSPAYVPFLLKITQNFWESFLKRFNHCRFSTLVRNLIYDLGKNTAVSDVTSF